MKPSEAKTLFEEVTNDAATWVDALFWYVMGVLTVGICWVMSRLG